MTEIETGRELTAWEEIGPDRAVVERSTRRSLPSRISDITDIDPSDPKEIIEELTPVLALVAPSGMDTAAKRVWYNAAVKALEGVPIALLKRGSRAAIAKADHPAKIIPAVMAEIREDWDWRRRYHAPRAVGEMPLPSRPSDDERLEVAGMIDDLLKKMGSGAASAD